MVETLIKAGASSSGERERDGQTPLHAAAEGGRYVLRRGRHAGEGGDVFTAEGRYSF